MPEFAKELAQKNSGQIAIRDDNKALDWNDVDEILNRVTNRPVSYTHLTLPTIYSV